MYEKKSPIFLYNGFTFKNFFLLLLLLFTCSNSDIWRNYPKFITNYIFPLCYLSNEQGCRTSIAASILDENELFPNNNNNNNVKENNDNDDSYYCSYIQPYWLPGISLQDITTTPYPLYEMMGPYQGYRITHPRIPLKLSSSTTTATATGAANQLTAGEALWQACTDLTGCTWPSPSSESTSS